MNEKDRKPARLQVKLGAAFAGVAILASALLCIPHYLALQVQLRDGIRGRLRDAVSVAALQIDAAAHRELKNSIQEGGPVYMRIKRSLQRIRDAATDIRFVYTMRGDTDDRIIFLVDAEADPARIAHLGEVYDDASPLLKARFKTLERPLVEEGFYTDKWGTWLTGYAPFYTSDGKRAGVVGMDIAAGKVLAHERRFLWITLAVFLATMPMAGLLGWMLGRRLARPITALTIRARNMAEDDSSPEVTVDGRDEIGSLAAAFNTMTEKLGESLRNLRTEVAERKSAEVALREAHDELEERVRHRTAELLEANEQLQKEMDERIRVAGALRWSEARFRALSEATFEAIFLSENGICIGQNLIAEQMFGYSSDEAVGRRGTDWIDPEFREHFLKMMLSGQEEPYEARAIRKDGATFPCEIQGKMLTYEGRLIRVIALRDITERKRAEGALRKSEHLYRSVIEHIEDVFYRTDDEGRLLMESPSGARLFGYDGVEEMIGLKFESFWVNPQDYKRLLGIVQEHGKVKDYEGFLTRKDGSTFTASFTTHFWWDENGTVRGMEGIIRDITERKRMEAQLLQSRKMETIGTLAGGIAHHVNNLLQVVLGHTDMLVLRKGTDDKSAKSIEAIRSAAHSGAELVKNILTFSRKTETRMKPVNLSDELRRVKELLRPTIPRMVTIEMNPADDLGTIYADTSQLEQVLLSLAVNANDAMPEGGRLLFETSNVVVDEEYRLTHPESEPGKYVLLSVSDTGHGMKREVLDRIFEPFFTTKQLGEGTGLGLSMVFGIVKSHGGHINCHSEIGVGTTFNIYFPVVEAEITREIPNTTGMPAGGTETVLLVDDEDAVRTLGAEMLDLAGYVVVTAADGQEALDIYREKMGTISLVILDLVMPEMSGKRCLEELLAIDPKVNVLIASGYSTDEPIKEDLESLAAGFISKPFDLKQFLSAVRKTMERGTPSESG
jgi:PAS domain S-box-containing protein